MTATDDAAIRTLLDRQEIHDLVTRYATAIDSRHWELLDTVFSGAARLDYRSAGGIHGEYPEVRRWLADALALFDCTQHLVLNREVHFQDGDRARGRASFLNPNQLTVGGELWTFTVGGYYHDRYERTPEGWRIVARTEETSWWEHPIPGLPPRPYPLPDDAVL